MILKVHVHGAASYDVGDEVWQGSLAKPSTPKPRRSPPMPALTCSSLQARHIARPSADGSSTR